MTSETALLHLTDTTRFSTDSWGLEEEESETKPWWLVDGGCHAWGTELFLLHIVWLSQHPSVFWAPPGCAKVGHSPLPPFFQPHNLLQISSYKLSFWRLGKVTCSCFPCRQRAQAQSRVAVQPGSGSEHVLLQTVTKQNHPFTVTHTALAKSPLFRSVKDYTATMSFI